MGGPDFTHAPLSRRGTLIVPLRCAHRAAVDVVQLLAHAMLQAQWTLQHHER